MKEIYWNLFNNIFMAFSNFILTHRTIEHDLVFFCLHKSKEYEKQKKTSSRNTSIIMRKICINVCFFFSKNWTLQYLSNKIYFILCCLFFINRQVGHTHLHLSLSLSPPICFQCRNLRVGSLFFRCKLFGLIWIMENILWVL